MARAIRIVIDSGDCVVPVLDAQALVTELRRLPADTHPDAAAAAVVIDATIEDETAVPRITLGPSERHSLGSALESMLVRERRLPEGLRCVRDALMIESGDP